MVAAKKTKAKKKTKVESINPKPVVKEASDTTKPRAKPTKKKLKAPKQLSPKEIADKNGEPYIAILSMELDPDDINNGAFELDWNDKFIVNLIKAGYQASKNDSETDLVDRWFQTVCRNIIMETYEQHQADPDNRMRVIRSRPLGNGRTEVS